MSMIILGILVAISIVGVFILLHKVLDKAKVNKKKQDEFDLE